MKFLTLTPLLSFAFAAPPPPAIRPMLPVDVFNITNFYASSTPHSVISRVTFDVTVTSISPPTSCYGAANSYQWVGDIPETNCTEPTVAFSFARGPNSSATLNIYWRLGEKGLMKGTYEIPGTEFEQAGANTSIKEVYTGSSEIVVRNLTTVRGIWED